ncbi:hypothetical protein P3T36_003345 [Kitasatospora sp. MAP12-15]|uniref:hypothetical protein n=1 Tax=unclassified Kitasatospora TaxID=2633591 RepID=UPI002476B65A|nr:hypothetical protein [Kitasatospora sp. MAP12-44]MDH6111321.1 hypothetical protein [Kitasatospora sp. MAP12-44]
MPALPPVTISRAPHTGVIAEGGDRLSRQLLDHLHWIEIGAVREHWHRLMFDVSVAWQNAEATKAAVLLTAAGYPVHLDPSLGTPPDQPAFVPSPAPEEADPALGVLSLIGRLQGTSSAQGAGEIAAAMFAEDSGVLARVQELVEAGAEWVRDNAPEDSDELHDLLDEASEVLYDLTVRLADVPESIRTLPTDHPLSYTRASAARLTSSSLPGTPAPAATATTRPPAEHARRPHGAR